MAEARQTISAAGAPTAIGPYSHATVAGDLLFLSGQTPLDPATGKLVEGDAATQTKRVFANLLEVLDAAGLTFGHVVKANVFLTDLSDFEAMNQEYAQVFSEPFPSRTTVEVAGLPLGASVEIELIARL